MAFEKIYVMEFTPKELQYLKDALLLKRQSVMTLQTAIRNNENCVEVLDGVNEELRKLYDKVALKPVKAQNTESEE